MILLHIMARLSIVGRPVVSVDRIGVCGGVSDMLVGCGIAGSSCVSWAEIFAASQMVW